MASGVLHVVYYVTLLRGYRKADLTVVYPLARGTRPLLSSLVAIHVCWVADIGAWALGIMGVVGGSSSDCRRARPAAAHARPNCPCTRCTKAWSMGCSTGAFIASYTVVDGYAVRCC